MRNAPIDAENIPWWFLPAGQRISARLPWYRGNLGSAMEEESRVLCDVVEREGFLSPFTLSIDSGISQ